MNITVGLNAVVHAREEAGGETEFAQQWTNSSWWR